MPGDVRELGPQAERWGILGVQMVLDTAKIKTQTISLGEPVTFESHEAEGFLRELGHRPSAERRAQLRAAVKEAAAVESSRGAGELLH